MPYQNLTNFATFDDIQYPFSVKKVKLSNDIEIAYVDEGSGKETIIFIHGLGSYLPAWKKNIDGLKSQYRCIAIDLPGYGKSSKNPHSGMMTFYAAYIKEFVEKLNLTNVILTGHSMGGQISMMAAMKYPDVVKKVILVAPAGFERFTEGQKQWFCDIMTLEGVKTTNTENIQTNLAYNFYNVPADAEFMITDRIAMRTAKDFDAYCYAVTQSVKGMVNEPVIDILNEIKQPTLILFGENDNLIPNRYLNPGKTIDIANYGTSNIKGSKLVMIPKCGHFAQFEKPEVINEEIRKFLN
jgi:pimeloyl-ACP methyl ester carboxylesterase